MFAQQSSNTGSNTVSVASKETKDDGWGIMAFICGLLLIPLSLVCLWKNEKKIVMYHRVIVNAQKACKSSDPKEIKDENDFELVHCQGTSRNEKDITDPDFGV